MSAKDSGYADDKQGGESKHAEAKMESKDDLVADSKDGSGKDFNSQIIEDVQEFFFGSEDLSAHFENFIKARCQVIDLTSTEYKLEYTEVFEEYKKEFERKMEGFITNKLNYTVQQFYQALKSKMDSDPNGNESIFGQILIALADFDIFMVMMKEAAAAQQSSFK